MTDDVLKSENDEAENGPRPEGWRGRVIDFVEGDRVQKLVMVLIIINAITLGLETSTQVMGAIGPVLHVLDVAVLSVFVFEIGAKLLGRGFGFFKSGWNIFDFSILVAGWAGMFYKLSTSAKAPTAFAFRIFRLFRALRALRVFSAMKIIGGTMTRGANAVVSATILFG
ncbi:MAG: ion transporter, partial [Rhodospirillales bacterium]|nr:ion transporter [Rhodospirillales bacterium]